MDGLPVAVPALAARPRPRFAAWGRLRRMVVSEVGCGMDRAELERRWRMTLGAGADLTALATDVTYTLPSGVCGASHPGAVSEQPTIRIDVNSSSSYSPFDAAPTEAFECLDELGRGGMGIVFRARQRNLDREVAVKTLLPQAEASEEETARARDSFLSEAIITGRLDHPNIVPVYDLGAFPNGDVFLAMKLLGGKPWREVLRGNTDKDLAYHLEVLIQVGNAVAFAHSHGIVHNDLKPHNVMIGEFGEVLVVDWGLAVDVRDRSEVTTRTRHRSDIDRPCGTPCYMPPELAEGRGDAIGPWTDIYLLGAILYELLSDGPPHTGKTLIEVVARASESEVPELAETVPEGLRKICRKALAKEPRERHESVHAFQEEIRAYLRHRESIAISEAAQVELDQCTQASEEVGTLAEAERNRLYGAFTEVVAGFRQAQKLWSQNPAALAGEQRALLAHARAALQREDFGLAESQLAQVRDDSEEVAAVQAEFAARKAQRARAQAGVRRLRLGLRAAVVAIVCGLALGVVVLKSKNRAIQSERDRYQDQKVLADRRGEIAESILASLTSALQDDVLSKLTDEESRQMARGLLRKALAGWEDLQAVRLEEDDSAHAIARLQMRIASLVRTVDGDLPGALAKLEDARRILAALQVNDPANLAVQDDLADVLLALGEVLVLQGNLPLGSERFDQALVLRRRSLESAPSSERRQSLAAILEGKGAILRSQGKLEQSCGVLVEALSVHRGLAAEAPADLRISIGLCRALGELGEVLKRLGDYAGARSSSAEALTNLRELAARYPTDPEVEDQLAAHLDAFAHLVRTSGDNKAALDASREAVAIRRGAVSRSPSSWKAQYDLMVELRMLSFLLWESADRQGSLAVLSEALSIARMLVKQDPSNTTTKGFLGLLLGGQAVRKLQLAMSNASNANEHGLGGAHERFAEAARLQRELVAASPGSVELKADLLATLKNLASALRNEKRLGEAEACAGEALQISRELTTQDPSSAIALYGLASSLSLHGKLLVDLGQLPAAHEALAEAVDLRRRLVNQGPVGEAMARDQLCGALVALGSVLQAKGDLEAARSVYEEAVAFRRAAVVQDPRSDKLQGYLASALARLGGLREAQGDLDGARTRYEEYVSIRRKLLTPTRGRGSLRIALGALSRVLWAQGEHDRALELTEEAVALCRSLLKSRPSNRSRRVSLAAALVQLADVVAATHDYDQAHRHYDEAIALWRDVIEQEGGTAPAQRFRLASALEAVGDLYAVQAQADQARAKYGEAEVVLNTHLEAAPADAEAKAALASLLKKQAKLGPSPEKPSGQQ